MIYGMRTSVLHMKAAIALGQHLTEWDDYRDRIETNEEKIKRLEKEVKDLNKRLAA